MSTALKHREVALAMVAASSHFGEYGRSLNFQHSPSLVEEAELDSIAMRRDLSIAKV